MKRGNYKLIEEMREALMKAYCDVYRFCWNQQEAWEKAVRSEAPRYYVSAKQAYLVLLPMVRGERKHLEVMTPEKKRMYESLFDKVMFAAQRPEFVGMSLHAIVPHVICEKAPEFFVGSESIRKTWRMMKRRERARAAERMAAYNAAATDEGR